MGNEKYLLYAVSYEMAGKFAEFHLPNVGELWTFDDFVVEVIEVDRAPINTWDESSDVKAVLRATHADGEYAYFVKQGRQTSYGDYLWSEKLMPVKPVTRTVYDYVETAN